MNNLSWKNRFENWRRNFELTFGTHGHSPEPTNATALAHAATSLTTTGTDPTSQNISDATTPINQGVPTATIPTPGSTAQVLSTAPSLLQTGTHTTTQNNTFEATQSNTHSTTVISPPSAVVSAPSRTQATSAPKSSKIDARKMAALARGYIASKKDINKEGEEMDRATSAKVGGSKASNEEKRLLDVIKNVELKDIGSKLNAVQRSIGTEVPEISINMYTKLRDPTDFDKKMFQTLGQLIWKKCQEVMKDKKKYTKPVVIDVPSTSPYPCETWSQIFARILRFGKQAMVAIMLPPSVLEDFSEPKKSKNKTYLELCIAGAVKRCIMGDTNTRMIDTIGMGDTKMCDCIIVPLLEFMCAYMTLDYFPSQMRPDGIRTAKIMNIKQKFDDKQRFGALYSPVRLYELAELANKEEQTREELLQNQKVLKQAIGDSGSGMPLGIALCFLRLVDCGDKIPSWFRKRCLTEHEKTTIEDMKKAAIAEAFYSVNGTMPQAKVSTPSKEKEEKSKRKRSPGAKLGKVNAANNNDAAMTVKEEWEQISDSDGGSPIYMGATKRNSRGPI